MFIKNLFNLFIFCIILKTAFSNVSNLSLFTTISEFEVSESATQFEINSTSDQLTTEQVAGERGDEKLKYLKIFKHTNCSIAPGISTF